MSQEWVRNETKPICYTISVVRSDGKVISESRIACHTSADLRRAIDSVARDAERNYE